MDRRELLKMIALITGGAVVGSEVFLSGCKNENKAVGLLLSEEDIPFLDEIAETILPATKTPGAKAAKLGQFMTVYVNDCYDDKDQELFRQGMKDIDDACQKAHGHSFMDATAEQRHDVLVVIDKKTKEAMDAFKKEQDEKEKMARDHGDRTYKRQEMPGQYFMLIKQLTLFGYFTSKEAITGALRFTPVPGKWEACVDYKKGEPAFAGLDGMNT